MTATRIQPDEYTAYTTALDSGDTPLLGHLVLYSVFDSAVTRADLERWFIQLGLDTAFLPPEPRPVDAFEKVTGPEGIRSTYSLDNPNAALHRDQRGRNTIDRVATLMVRHVRRDNQTIVRHLVREVRDEHQTSLSYDTRLGTVEFVRASDPTGGPGAGSLQVTPDHKAITALPEPEAERVRAVLDAIGDAYRRQCVYIDGGRLRALLRRYIEGLNAVRVRPTGGVYFVHRQHADALSSLRELVTRFGQGSHLTRIPIPDADEMREMVVNAFTNKARDDLNKLARDIANADPTESTIASLHKRFQAMKDSTSEHQELLGAALNGTTASLNLVQAQLASLLMKASGNDDETDA